MSESLKNVMVKKADQVRHAADIIAGKTKDWQMIKQYLCGRLTDMELTNVQQEKLKRYQFIYNQLVSGKYTEQDVINQVVRIYNVGLPQAYEDKNSTQEIFSSVLSINKRFEQKMELESAKDLKRKCVEIGDFKSAAAFQKNIIALQKEIEEVEENPGELFEGHTIEGVFDPKLLGAPDVRMKDVLKAINEKRKVKINMDLFEDIEHEEVNDNH